MHTIDFPEANITLNKPANMTDEQCDPLRAMASVDDQGFPGYTVLVQPNKEDIEAIIAGRPIALRIMGTMFPPFSIWTWDENGQGNF